MWSTPDSQKNAINPEMKKLCQYNELKRHKINYISIVYEKN